MSDEVINTLEEISELCTKVIEGGDDSFRLMAVDHMRKLINELASKHYTRKIHLRRIDNDSPYEYQIDS